MYVGIVRVFVCVIVGILVVCMCRASFSFPLLMSAKKTRISFILHFLWKLDFFDSVKHIALQFLQTSFRCGKLHCLPLILQVFVRFL